MILPSAYFIAWILVGWVWLICWRLLEIWVFCWLVRWKVHVWRSVFTFSSMCGWRRAVGLWPSPMGLSPRRYRLNIKRNYTTTKFTEWFMRLIQVMIFLKFYFHVLRTWSKPPPPFVSSFDWSNIFWSISTFSSCGADRFLESYGVSGTLFPDWFEKANGKRPKLRRKRFDAECDSACGVLRFFFDLLSTLVKHKNSCFASC